MARSEQRDMTWKQHELFNLLCTQIKVHITVYVSDLDPHEIGAYNKQQDLVPSIIWSHV